MEYWQNELVQFAFTGNQARCEIVCQFFVGNKFSNISQLRDAEHPTMWSGMCARPFIVIVDELIGVQAQPG